MFIKLTRLDGTPIWINASFVVTVEPRKGGGSIVVPIGDGLDYDVKESTDVVLQALGEAPAPAVVPVPPPPGLAPKTLGLPPEPAAPSETSETATSAVPGAAPSAAPAPVRKTTRSRAKAKAASSAAEGEPTATADAAGDEKPAVRRTRTTKKAKKPELTLSEDELARLRKLTPGSVRKLQNTLVAQFRTQDPVAEVAALEAAGILSLDRDRVIWK